MKGIVFTEFLELVDARWGIEMSESLIEACQLPSGGAYTAVGIYDHREIAALATELSKRSGMPLADLLKVFGRHLFGKLAAAHPRLVDTSDGLLDFLGKVETYIHVEVRKLYPDAELPTFRTVMNPDGSLDMLYLSSRHLEDLCEGLIQGAADRFARPIILHRRPADGGVLFTIRHEP
jgi:hypothetical protein